MAGFLDTQSGGNQIEALYIGYFSRAGDGPGYLYWTNSLASMESHGTAVAQAVVNVANSFAVQPEAQAQYSLLASPPARPLNPADPVQSQAVDSFINQIYLDYFNRAADSAGLTYWHNQIFAGLAVGNAVYAIANGALGGDQTVLASKIAAGTFFTSQTFAANIDSGATFLTNAHNAVTGVIDPATQMQSEAATTAYVTQASAPSLVLTPGVDTLITDAAGAVFHGEFANAAFEATKGSFNIQTVNPFDSLTDSAPTKDGTLVAQFNDGAVVGNFSMSGVATATLSTVSGIFGLDGFQGQISDLKTVNDSFSDGSLQVGGGGNGLKTALTNVNILNPVNSPAVSHSFEADIAAAALAGATDAISLGVTSAGLQATVKNGFFDSAAFVAIGPDDGGTNGYEIWNIAATGKDYVELDPLGATSATTINITGSGSLELSALTPADFAKVATIDASKMTGTGALVITGAAGGHAGGYAVSGDVGLLAGNGALTSFTGAGGTTFLDLTNLTTAQAAKITTLNAGTGTGTNTVIFSNAVAEGTAAIAGISNFEVIGIGTALTAGTINLANFGTSANDITLFADVVAGASKVTINGGTNPFTLNLNGDTHAVAGDDFTINGPAGATDAFTLDMGNNTHFDAANVGSPQVDHVGVLTANEYETTTIHTAAGTATTAPPLTDTIGSIVFAGHAGAGETLKVDGVDSVTVAGSILGTFEIDDTTSGVLTFGATNAQLISAGTSGGIVMTAADTGNAGTNTGVTITGSTAHHNVMNGSVGADTFNAGAGGDNIVTGGGTNLTAGATHADVVNLVAGATDHIALYAGAGVPDPVTGIVPAIADSITSAADLAQPGWWGVGVGAAATQFGGLAANTGTDHSAVQINGFNQGTTKGDIIDISIHAWGFSGTHDGLDNLALDGAFPTLGNAIITTPVGSSGTVPVSVPQSDVLLLTGGGPFADANQLASSLHSTFPINFATGAGNLPVGFDAHVIVLYNDTGNNAHIADLELSNNTAAATGASNMLTEHASDMAVLVGVNADSLVPANIHFVA